MKLRRAILRVNPTVILVCLSLMGINLFLASPAYSSNDEAGKAVSDWKFAKPIHVQGDAPYNELFLDEEVYRSAAPDLADLRIIDEAGKRVPFYRESGDLLLKENKQTYSSQRIHRAVKGTDTLFDFKIVPVQENADIAGSRLVLGLPSGSFLKQVEVFGSYDGNVWEPLKQDEIYLVNQLKRDSLDLGNVYKFEYYRLLVKNNVEKLDFTRLNLVYDNREILTANYTRELVPTYEITQEESKTLVTVNNPNRMRIVKVIMDSSGNFNRSYELRDDKGMPVMTAGEGKLYRLDFQDSKITATDIVPQQTFSPSRFTIVIDNRDDAPIQIGKIRLEVEVDKIIFPHQGDKSYRLLYGNPQAAPPQFDLISFKEHIEGGKVNTAVLGTEQTIHDKGAEVPQKVQWYQKKWIFNVILAGVSLLLIIMLIRKLNKSL